MVESFKIKVFIPTYDKMSYYYSCDKKISVRNVST